MRNWAPGASLDSPYPVKILMRMTETYERMCGPFFTKASRGACRSGMYEADHEIAL
jgi:hypothetical protein